jgi:hypothetical protein
MTSGVKMLARHNPNPATFPITVCEALLGPGTPASVRVGDMSYDFPLPDRAPTTAVVLGDTGCRDDAGQICDERAEWPLRQIADSAAADLPGVVVHLGDYQYRGTPGKLSGGPDGDTDGNNDRHAGHDGSDGPPDADVFDGCLGATGDENAADSAHPDNWAAWDADLFTPARKLLEAAPWIFVRGNHELCSRAGPGYFYLLDPRSRLYGDEALTEAGCPAEGLPAVDVTAPYAVTLDTTAVVVFDSASACDGDEGAPLDAAVTGAITRHLATVSALVGGAPAWLATHRPIWAVTHGAHVDPARLLAPTTINATLQAAVGEVGIPNNVELVLSGHSHRFEALTFPRGRPPQIVLGNGGAELAAERLPRSFSASVDGRIAQGVADHRHGYLAITRLVSPRRWSGEVRTRGGAPISTCAMPAPGASICTAPPSEE